MRAPTGTVAQCTAAFFRHVVGGAHWAPVIEIYAYSRFWYARFYNSVTLCVCFLCYDKGEGGENGMANLLLVEDDASVRRLVTLQLSLVGYDVRAAEDAAAARALLADGAPDLAILDIMLPGEDGFSLAETMIEREIPVLFLTAKTAVNDRVRGLRLGAEDYMLKLTET